MERRYFALHTRAAPETTLAALVERIRSQQLGELVPLIMMEKRLRQLRRRQPFYLVLAINTETEAVPLAIKELAQTLLRSVRFMPVTGKEARRFAVTGFEAIDNVVVIPFQPPRRVEMFASAAVAPTAVAPPARDERSAARNYENLLRWLSAHGQGTLTRAQQTAHKLGLLNETESCRSVLRRLRLLGHLELSDEGRHWAMGPSCLARLPVHDTAGALAFALCGARSAKLTETLQAKAVDVRLLAQPAADGPPTCLFYYATGSEVAQICRENSLLLTDAAQLAETLLPVDDWRAGLPIVTGVIPSLYEKSRWLGGQFHAVETAHAAGFYELLRPNAQTAPLTLYHDADAGCWRRGDWYGLRFLASEDKQALFVKGQFAVPLNQRWPLLYEKALVLATGRLPRRSGAWLIYPDVPSPLAVRLCAQLNVALTMQS